MADVTLVPVEENEVRLIPVDEGDPNVRLFGNDRPRSGGMQSVLGIASQSDKEARAQADYLVRPETIKNVIVPVPALAAAQIAQGVGGKVRQVGDVTGSEGMAAWGKDFSQSGADVEKEIQAEHPLDNGTWANSIRNAGASMYQQLPSLVAAGPLVKAGMKATGMAAALVPMGAVTGGQSYGKYRDRGFDVGTASAGSAIDELIEVGTELLPAGRLLTYATSPAKLAVKQLATTMIKMGGEEYFGETLAALGQGITNKYLTDPNLTDEQRAQKVDEYFTKINPATGNAEYLDDFKEAWRATTAQMVMTAGMGAGAKRLTQSSDKAVGTVDAAPAGGDKPVTLSPYQNEAYDDIEDMPAPKGPLESATSQTIPATTTGPDASTPLSNQAPDNIPAFTPPTTPVTTESVPPVDVSGGMAPPSAAVSVSQPIVETAREVTEADQVDFENAVKWAVNLEKQGRAAIPEIAGESTRDQAWRLLEAYRKVITPAVVHDSGADTVHYDNEQENGAINGATDSVPTLQSPSKVEREDVGLSGVQSEDTGRTDNISQPGGLADDLSKVQQEAGPAEEVPPVRGAAVVTPIDEAAHVAATSPHNDIPEPTQAQIEAGNYKKGRIRLHGLDISIENPAGSLRKGTDETGKAWETKLAHHYGYIKGTVGKDKDHVDVFIKPGIDQANAGDKVFVIDQKNLETGKFDEHKVMAGFDSYEEASKAYQSNYDIKADDFSRVLAVSGPSVATFKNWLDNGDQNKPFAGTPWATKREYIAPEGSVVSAKKEIPSEHIADIERSLAAGNGNATLIPDVVNDKGVDSVASIANYETALQAAGWEKQGKDWRKGNYSLWLRSQGNLSAPIVQFSVQSEVSSSTPDSEETAKKASNAAKFAQTRLRALERKLKKAQGPVMVKKAQKALDDHKATMKDAASEPVKEVASASVITVDVGAETLAEWIKTLPPKIRMRTAARMNEPGGIKIVTRQFLEANPEHVAEKVAVKASDSVETKKPSVKTNVPRKNRIKKLQDKIETGALALTERDELNKLTAIENPAPVNVVDVPVGFGDGNKLFTKDKADRARETLRAKLNQLNAGLDPEMVTAGIDLAGYYIEGGFKSFKEYSGKMIEDLGESIKPFLKSFYLAVRNYPGFDNKGTDSEATIDELLAVEVVEAAVAPKILTKHGNKKLRGDYGVKDINGYTPAGEKAKNAFLGDAKAYLKEVAQVLKDNGYMPEKINSNPGGVAGSGDVSLLAFKDGSDVGLYVTIGAGTSLPMVSQSPSGIQVMYRATTRKNKYQGLVNRWDAGWDSTTGDLSAKMLAEAQKHEPAAAKVVAEKPLASATSSDIVVNEKLQTQEGAPDEIRGNVDKTAPVEEPTGVEATQGRGAAGRSDGGSGPDRAGDRTGHDQADGKGSAAKHPVSPKSAGAKQRPPRSAGNGSQRDNGILAGGHGLNYRITDADNLGKGGAKQKARDNIAAVRLVKQLTAEERPATPEEQAQLVKYVGWGASELANGIFENTGYNPATRGYNASWFKEGWEDLGKELKDLLSREEYDAAKKSTVSAYYTPSAIVEGMYNALDQLGFTGGRVLEPGTGVGHFIGMLPDSLLSSTRVTGVELDNTSAAIARLLYPGHDIRHQGFEKFVMPDGFYDVAIGNPPFVDLDVTSDPAYARHKFKLHDYFFAKSIDKVRPGGLLMFVTSKGTMDKASDKARAYLSERADLLGAIRLPETAFKENAGTETVTDVIFLRKRAAGEESTGKSWNVLKEVKTPDGKTHINEYFADNPQMVLGKNAITSSQFGPKYTVLPHNGTTLAEQFNFAVKNYLPNDIYKQDRAESPADRSTAEYDLAPSNIKEGAFYLDKSGAVMSKESGVGVPSTKNSKDLEVVKSFIPLRDAVRQVLYVQIKGGDLAAAQKVLKKQYDAFVKKHGVINSEKRIVTMRGDKESISVRTPNFSPFRDDPDAYLVASIERYNDEANSATPGPIFTERTIKPETIPQINSITDALHVVMHEAGAIDIPQIAAHMNVTEAQAIDALGAAIYHNPQTMQWETDDEYLSGNVKQKLALAESSAQADPAFKRNVEALKAVQPEDLPPSRISIGLGEPIVKPEHIERFAKEVISMGIKVAHLKNTGSWGVEKVSGYQTTEATSDWGTARRNAAQLIDDALNSRQIRIEMYIMQDGVEKKVFDKDATNAANEKLAKIKERFAGWVWEHPERSEEMSRAYNDAYNNTVKRVYGGDHISKMTFPGMSAAVNPFEHQKRVAWRVVQSGNTYMAHSVGAGKTIGSILAGMELKRLGIKKKPMWVVPNHMLKQFASEFLQLYPAAKIMVADENQFSKENRNRFMGRVAAENWDGIIITHSAFGKMQVSPDFSAGFIRDQIDELDWALNDTDKGDRLKRKQIEQAKARLEQRLEKVLSAADKDKGVTFEETGIDQLFVDEAHEFRKLDFTTNQTNIKGIDPNGSLMAFDLYVKSRYLEKLYPGRSLVLMSGTAITNTIGEIFTIQRFLQEGKLKELGLDNFDAWASTFGDLVTKLEATPAGNYKPVTRFAKFKKLASLSQLWSEVGDFIHAKDLTYIKRPSVKGGGRILVTGEQSEIQQAYKRTLADRIKAIERRKRPPQKGDDILLSVITDGRHAALDERYISSGKPGKDNKLEKMVGKVSDIWKDTKKDKLTQMIFVDLGTPGSEERRGFSAYNQIVESLVAQGIPAKEIAVMQNYKKSDEKQKLFRAMNEGTIRVLIGSSEAMGTGVNAQKKLVALHHLDPDTYLPSNIEQREGRIVRQGNSNAEVQLYAYVTKGSYDETMWQFLETKQRFIDQFLSGEAAVDEATDIDGGADSFAMARAMSSDNPLILERAGIESDIQRLESLRRAHFDDQQRLKVNVSRAEQNLPHYRKEAAALEKVIARRVDTAGDKFALTLDGATFDERKKAGEALGKAIDKMLTSAEKHDLWNKVGTVAGLNIMARSGISLKMPWVTLEVGVDGTNSSPINFQGLESTEELDPVGVAMKLENLARSFDRHLADIVEQTAKDEKTLNDSSARIGRPFEHAGTLADKQQRLNDIETILRAEEQKSDAGNQSNDTTLHSNPMLNPALIVSSLSGLAKNLKEDIPKLVNLGQVVIRDGASKYQQFLIGMKQYLGDKWDAFKGLMLKVYHQAKAEYKNSPLGNEIGAIGDIQPTYSKVTAQIGDSYISVRDNRLRVAGFDVETYTMAHTSDPHLMTVISQISKDGKPVMLVSRIIAGKVVYLDNVKSLLSDSERSGVLRPLYQAEADIAQRYGLTIRADISNDEVTGKLFKEYYPQFTVDVNNPMTYRADHENTSQSTVIGSGTAAKLNGSRYFAGQEELNYFQTNPTDQRRSSGTSNEGQSGSVTGNDSPAKHSIPNTTIMQGDSGLGDVTVTPAKSLPFIKRALDQENADQVLVKGGNVDALKRVATGLGKTIVFFRGRGQDAGNGLLGTGNSDKVRDNQQQNDNKNNSSTESTGSDVANGFVNPAQPNIIFLNVDSSSHLLYITGHELSHTIKMQDPALWNQMAKELQPLVRRWSQFKESMPDRYDSLSEEDKAEELFSDVMGHHFLSDMFWQDLAKENAGLFTKIARKAVQLINKVLHLMAGSDVRTYISDLEQSRSIIAKTLLQYGENVNKEQYGKFAEQQDLEYLNSRLQGQSILEHLRSVGISDEKLRAALGIEPEATEPAKFSIKRNLESASEKSLLENLKGILNPLDYSRFRNHQSEHRNPAVLRWLADNIGNPFWVKENNPDAVPFYEEAKDREVTRMDNNVRMFGGLFDKEGKRVGWDKVKGLFDWSDKTTGWGKVRQEMYNNLTDKQKAAYDVIRFEGDAYNKTYAKLADALRNVRIKAAGMDAQTFAFYQTALAEEAKAFDVKLAIAQENMAEAGMTPEDIEGHIAEYRAKYKDIEGWVHRDHGEGEYQVRVYQTVDSLDFESDVVQHKGEPTDRIRLGAFPGAPLSRSIEEIVERRGGSFKQLRNGAIIVLMPEGQGQKTLAEFNKLSLVDKDGEPKYKVLAYNRFVSSIAEAKKLTAKVKSDYQAAMPRNYREGYSYETSWNFSAKVNEEDYQVLKTSDMKLELILRSAIDKAKAKSDVTAAEAEAIKDELVRSTAEILLGRGAGLYQIRRAQYLIEGYDTDNAVKKYEDYINGTAGLFSKARYALRQFNNMKSASPQIRAWATKYVGDSLRNMGTADKISGNMRAIVSLWYLGFNTSWMLVNSTQPYVLGQAELSRYTTSPALKIARAEKDILTGKLSDVEKALLEDIQVRSQDHDSVMAEMTGSLEGVTGKASQTLHNVTQVAMALGQKVEVLNRHTMIVAGYRVFKEQGMGHATALKKALDVNSMVNIDMGRYNLPGWARGPIGRTFYALQSYIQHMLNYLYNRSSSGNRNDQKAVLRLLFAMFLIGGLPAGAPGSDELDKLIQKMFGYSPKLALKGWSRKMAKDYGSVGEMLEGFVWHGVPGALKPFGVGVSLTGSTQLRLPIISNVIGGDDMFRALGGPVAGLFTKGKQSIQAAMRGDWGRATEYLLPTAIANPLSAIRQATDGVKTASGKRVEYKGKQLKMEPQEAVIRAFGLQPVRTADISETRGFEKNTQAEWNDRRKDALDNYRMSRKLKFIQDFNKDLRGSQAQGLVPAISAESLANVWGKTNKKKNSWEREHGAE